MDPRHCLSRVHLVPHLCTGVCRIFATELNALNVANVFVSTTRLQTSDKNQLKHAGSVSCACHVTTLDPTVRLF